MSNVLAIAAVTESLVALLTSYIDLAQVTSALVSNITPDQNAKPANPGINVFLYQVTPNAAYRNADLPTRAADGSFLKKPQAAVDLHYLLTFYGDDTLLEQQRLLGAATLALHVNPTLPRANVQPAPISPGVTATSELETQHELIRFTPVAFTLEELSKVWSFLFKIDYVLSAAYRASVVLIEEDDAIPPPALPVLTFNVTATPLRQPTILQVTAAVASAPIVAGSDIALLGRNLTASSGAATQVLINGATVGAASITATRITLTLPPGLAAGPQTAQIMQPMGLGVPPVPHAGTGSASGIAAFVLQPQIAPGAAAGSYAISVQAAGGSPPGLELVVTIIPTVLTGQRVLLQLLPLGAPGAGRLFDGGTLTADSDTVIVPIPGLPSGSYVVRALIDGAESPVVVGAGGAPVAPSITI